MSTIEKMVEKKVKARKRHNRVAEEYRKWLRENPKATMKRKMKTFDALVDSAFLEEQMKR
jgi:hypothetical protein